MMKTPTRTTRQPRGVRRPRRSRFTLIELMVVISIIALLMAILLPSLGQAREQAQKVICLSNLHQLANALEAYVQDYNAYPLFLVKNDANRYAMCSWAWGGKTTTPSSGMGPTTGAVHVAVAQRVASTTRDTRSDPHGVSGRTPRIRCPDWS